ncbi:DUF732 domain-containing protein [Mycobacterium sp. pUA109]|uniref:DUF732 domain-containing protein n=1 Tax=Mycobacterium sp. pUA109 TaxID=3238982 RepID=UPI00351B7F79
MKPLLALLSAITMIGLAVPAYGEPDAEEAAAVDNAGFLSSLRQAGISYNNEDQAISAARAVCGLIGNGESGLELLKDLKSTNPALTTDGAAQFAAIAARAYCPHQLTPSGGGSK